MVFNFLKKKIKMRIEVFFNKMYPLAGIRTPATRPDCNYFNKLTTPKPRLVSCFSFIVQAVLRLRVNGAALIRLSK